MRPARSDDAEGSPAQGEGDAPSRGPRRLRRAGAQVAELDVCPLDELPPGEVKIVHAGSISIGVYNLGGELYALEDRCSHDDGPLCEGDFDAEDGYAVCPRHGAHIEIRTGRPLTLPAILPVQTFPVRVDDGIVKVDVR